MRVKYFPATDTALVEFSDREVTETREINENIYVDLDGYGNLIARLVGARQDRGVWAVATGRKGHGELIGISRARIDQ